MAEFKKIKEELVYKGKIVDVYEDHLELPDGREVVYDLVKHKGAAAVLPIDQDGKIILVKQYRNALERETLEIPAGGLNSVDEPFMLCASRELEEETGYKSDNVEPLIDIITAIGFSNEKVGIFLARDLVKTCQHLDEDEFVDVMHIDVDTLIKMILERKIIDAKTIAAVLAYKEKYL